MEFMRGLLMMVVEKMVTDLPDIMYDEHLFSHLVDEALLFDRDLRLSSHYPANFPGCLHVLTQGAAFDKWLVIENKCTYKRYKA
jgi:hypothetical protein